MRAFSSQLQISPLSSAISKHNQAKLIILNQEEVLKLNNLHCLNKLNPFLLHIQSQGQRDGSNLLIQYIFWGPTNGRAPPRPRGTGLPCHGTASRSAFLSTWASWFNYEISCWIWAIWSDNFISNFSVFNNIKITVYCSVCMRTSCEKVRISDEGERVQSVSLSIEETGQKGLGLI